MSNIPKRIWFLWFQGIDHAPSLVKTCLDSWVHWNPDWDIEVLDETIVSEYLPDVFILYKNTPGMTLTSFSDLIRVNLLFHYGGVWVDSTTLCRKPLEAWLPIVAKHGFFSFSNPGRDRLIASWFIAAEKNNSLIEYWRYLSNNYWQDGSERILVDIPQLFKSPEYSEQRTNTLL